MPQSADERVLQALEQHKDKRLPEAVTLVAADLGYTRSAVYGMRNRALQKRKTQAAPAPVVPDDHYLKAVSTLVDASGNVKLQWMKTDKAKQGWQALIDVALTRLQQIEPLPAAPRPQPTAQALTLYPLADWHVGLQAARYSADWTLDRAAQTYRNAFARTLQSTSHGLLAFLGDFTHIDNRSNATPRSGHTLNVSASYAEVVETAMQLVVDVVALALDAHGHVSILYLAGNHDEATAVVMQAALRHLYANEPRVTVFETRGFYYYLHGKTLLGFTHGHTAKREDLPLIMATDSPTLWGEANRRVWHTGHVHHRTAQEFRGCTVETHGAPVPSDAWHYEKGYRSQRTMQSIVYDEVGERARVTVHL